MSAGQRGYLEGLKLLARRELSEAQLRARLLRRKIDRADVDEAVRQLRRDGALDDRRAALACARTEVRLRGRGRARVVRQVEALGVARELARAAVAEVFTDVDEAALLEQALDRRLCRGLSLDDDADVRRIHRYLLAQGFDAARVLDLIRKRAVKVPG